MEPAAIWMPMLLMLGFAIGVLLSAMAREDIARRDAEIKRGARRSDPRS